jgi:sec-independent protein translocase protein TatA
VVGDILQPTHLLFVLVVALLVLGPKRLPEVGRSLGRTMRDFRSALSGEEHQTIVDTTPTAPVPPAAVPAPEAETAVQPAEELEKPEPVERTDATMVHAGEPATAEHQPTAAP